MESGGNITADWRGEVGNRRRYHGVLGPAPEPLMLLMCSTVCVRIASGVGILAVPFGCEMILRAY